MIYGITISGCIILAIWLVIIYEKKYEMGEVTYKSKQYFEPNENSHTQYFVHCITKSGQVTSNHKLPVSKEVYDSVKMGDKFPVKF